MRLIRRPFIILIITTLIMRTFIIISRRNWLFLWCGLEINLLRFIPLIISSNKFQEQEAATKYFLIQALGRSLILISSSLIWFPHSNIPASYIAISAILLKLGIAPCHYWFPSVISSLSWINCLILSTWQKLGPLTILTFILQSSCTPKIIIIIAAINSIIGGLIGINQRKLKSIIAYSSITHIGWIIRLLVVINPLATLLYYFAYTIILLPLFIIIRLLSVNTQPQLQNACRSQKLIFIYIPLIIISIRGIPPLTGFFPKLITINILIPQYPILLIILITGAIINIFFYLNISFNIITSPLSPNNIYQKINNQTTWTINISIIILIIPLSTLIYAMTLLNKS